MKPRYRILWDRDIDDNVDLWKVGTKKFYFFHSFFNEFRKIICKRYIKELSQRVGLNN